MAHDKATVEVLLLDTDSYLLTVYKNALVFQQINKFRGCSFQKEKQYCNQTFSSGPQRKLM